MRAVLGMVSVLLVLAVVGLLAKKQLSATRLAVPVLQQSTPAAGGAGSGAVPPAGGTDTGAAPVASVRAQSQQLQQRYKETVEGLLQQPRPLPEDAN